jgi:tight adherence protein C
LTLTFTAAALASLSAACAVFAASSPPHPGLEGLGSHEGLEGVGRLRRALDRIGRSRPGRSIRRERLIRLIAASDVRWSPDEIAGAKLAASAVWAVAVVAPAPVALLVLPLAIASFRVPDMALGRRARRRVAAASREVPVLLDLLSVATSAGLAPQLALRLALPAVEGPLGRELRFAVGRTDLGRRWRDELEAVAERLALRDLRRAVALLRRTESLGSSLAAEMSRLAADVREERRSRMTERARAAPVKMLFPLVFLILPAFLLLTVVPVLLSTVRSID